MPILGKNVRKYFISYNQTRVSYRILSFAVRFIHRPIPRKRRLYNEA